MSRSNPTETLKNPAEKFIDWSGSEGKFKWYNKEEKDEPNKGINYIELPFTFIPLDTLVTVKGYNEPEGISYWSNEVRNIQTDIITVRSKSGVVMSALWEGVKAKLKPKGAKYFQSVYVAIKEGKEYKLANLQIGGSALKPFMDFCKDHKLMEVAVTVKSFTNEKKGANKYKAPVFEVVAVSEKANEAAIELDKILQEYLTAYLAKNASAGAVAETPDTQDNGLNDKPKSEPKSETKSTKKEKDLVIDNDEYHDDENAPF